MARRSGRVRGDSGAAERRRTRRALLVMAGTLGVMIAAFVAAWFWPSDGHDHPRAPHGGVVVPLGDGDGHGHAEAVLGDAGSLVVYTAESTEDQRKAVESQALSAELRPRGAGAAVSLVLLPRPQGGDPPGTTSRFVCRVPVALRGRPLTLTVPELAADGRRFRIRFDLPAGPPTAGSEEERVWRTAGGKYTEADIKANGGRSAAEKYRGEPAGDHDFRPRPGDRVCPITRAKARGEWSWTVGGQEYLFCCSPCVDEFVRLARDHPGEVSAAGDYVQK